MGHIVTDIILVSAIDLPLWETEGGGFCPPFFPPPPLVNRSIDISCSSLISDIYQVDGNISLDSSTISEDSSFSSQPDTGSIPVIITRCRPAKPNVQSRKTANTVIICQNKKVFTATQLPTVINLNPRSVYNKRNEFKDMMKQLDVDICCMSESWDKKKFDLEKVIQMDGYQIVKNVLQREGNGGKPALIIKKDKFFVKELSPSVITVPPTVEASWALLTPKIQLNAEVKHIAVASVYYAKRTKRRDFIDHICEAYNVLLAKYGQGLQFIIAGDFNRININPILDLSPSLSQIVQIPTRTNPDATLDKIITTLSRFYLPPTTLPPLDNDTEGNGKPSDHLIVVMSPICQSNQPKPKKKIIKFRPMPESGMLGFKQWLQSETWQELYKLETAHQKAEYFHSVLLEKLDLHLPEKIIKIEPNDEPWTNNEIKSIERRMKREYRKHKKSSKWKNLNTQYEEKYRNAKHAYSENIVNDLKESNPSQWYSKIKRMSSHAQEKNEETIVQDMIGLPDSVQVEKIADQFSSVSNEYSPIMKEDIDVESIRDTRPLPDINPYVIYLKIMGIKKKTSTVRGDVPMKLIKFCAEEMSFPLAEIYERAIKHGEYPNVYMYI